MNILDYEYYNFKDLIDPYILEDIGFICWTYNTSVVKARENNIDYLIYAVRTELYIPTNSKIKYKEDDEHIPINYNDIIPGNSEICEDYKHKEIDIDYGDNFVWNKWHTINKYGYDSSLVGSYTCFILYNMKTKEYKLLEIKNPDYRMNYYTKTTKYLVKLGDVRICNVDGEIIVHSSELDFISKVDINDNSIKFNIMTIGRKLWIYRKIYKKAYPYDRSLKGANYAIISINDNKWIKFLDWFYDVGLMILKININTERYLHEYYPYDPGYVIHGEGSNLEDMEIDQDDSEEIEIDDLIDVTINNGLMPKLSFSTPLLRLEPLNNGYYLGVGHLKIDNLDDYIPGSNISIFKEKVHTELRSIYGDNYKIHLGSGTAPYCQGSIYCIYFYLYNNDTQDLNYQMHIYRLIYHLVINICLV